MLNLVIAPTIRRIWPYEAASSAPFVGDPKVTVVVAVVVPAL